MQLSQIWMFGLNPPKLDLPTPVLHSLLQDLLSLCSLYTLSPSLLFPLFSLSLSFRVKSFCFLSPRPFLGPPADRFESNRIGFQRSGAVGMADGRGVRVGCDALLSQDAISHGSVCRRRRPLSLCRQPTTHTAPASDTHTHTHTPAIPAPSHPPPLPHLCHRPTACTSPLHRDSIAVPLPPQSNLLLIGPRTATTNLRHVGRSATYAHSADEGDVQRGGRGQGRSLFKFHSIRPVHRRTADADDASRGSPLLILLCSVRLCACACVCVRVVQALCRR